MKRLSVILILALVLSGCSAGAKVRTVDLGIITTARYIAGGWGSPPLMEVHTEKEVVILRDFPSVPTGVHGYYDYYEDGQRRFWWDGAEFSYRTTRRTPTD